MIVDLSHVLETGIQVYPGDPLVTINQELTIQEHSVNVLNIHMGSQSGTHIDSPFHVFTDGKKLNEIDLNRFMGVGVVIDATDLGDREEIPTGRFLDTDLSGASIALVKTGWSAFFGTDKYLAHPYPNIESLAHLRRHGITTIALDFLSLDRTPGPGEEFTLDNHYFWSVEDGIIGENLCRLEQITHLRPNISMLPLNLGPSDGAPVRAIASW